jgi:glucosamine--fructose-6-phosphate aminotransferase (isomerizing)
MSRFRDEIFEQPEAAERLIGGSGAQVGEIAAELRRRRLAGLVIAARGSSDHAATYAKYLFEIRNGIPVALAAPSAYTLYRRAPRLAGFGVIAVSQSGSSEDVIAVVDEGRRQGAPTVVITNSPGSPLAAAADHVLDLTAGAELSVPASKTYTSSLILLAMLSQALDPEKTFGAALAALSRAIRGMLALESELARAAEALQGPRLAVLGRGFNLATAQEVALKVMETCAVLAESRSVADFMHGPIAVVGPGFPVLLIEASGPTLNEMEALRGRLVAGGARTVVLTDIAEVPAHEAELVVRLACGLPEALTPIPFAVAGQLLALAMCDRLGLDPDRPPGLQKVTITR